MREMDETGERLGLTKKQKWMEKALHERLEKLEKEIRHEIDLNY